MSFTIKNCKAFTLMELITVIIIVSVLSFSVIPRMFSISNFTKDTFYKDVLSSIRYAQKVAVGMGCDVQVDITATTMTLLVRQGCSSGNINNPSVSPFNQLLKDPGKNTASFIRTAPSDITLSGIDFPIYFDSLGRVHKSSNNTIINTSLAVGDKNINIIGETGYVYN